MSLDSTDNGVYEDSLYCTVMSLDYTDNGVYEDSLYCTVMSLDYTDNGVYEDSVLHSHVARLYRQWCLRTSRCW